jgi:nucleoside-diphosphate-sugar epimerase
MNNQDESSPLKNSLVLVTGATGFTGAFVVRKLIERGAKVRAIARNSSSLEYSKELPIEWVRGHVYDPEVIERAIKGVEYIFHVAAAYREAKITDETYRLVHVQSTQLLVQAAQKQPQFKRFVHLSTVGVHGHIDEPPANEEYIFSPGDMYQSTKAEAELWIREFGEREKFPFVVIRPAAIYGPGDKRLFKVFKMAARRFFPLFGSGRGLYHLIHVEDLADIVLLAAYHPKAVGEVFIAGNKAPSSLQEMARIISDELGNTSLKFLRLPVWPLFLLAALTEAVCKPLGIEPPIYKRRVAFFTKDRCFNTDKLHTLLGYSEQFTNEIGLRSTARWYRAQGWL